jgi:CubicO group peptidase (beta-lactamase class C family)
MGYRIGPSLLGPGEPMTSFGHTGAGGTLGFADPVHGFALALTKTRMVFGPHQQGVAARVTRAARQALGLNSM